MLERVKDNPDDEDTAEMSKLLYDTALLNSALMKHMLPTKKVVLKESRWSEAPFFKKWCSSF